MCAPILTALQSELADDWKPTTREDGVIIKVYKL